MPRKKKVVVWKGSGARQPTPGPMDLSREIEMGQRAKVLPCPVCSKPLNFRIWSARQMEAHCPVCNAIVAIYVPDPSNSADRYYARREGEWESFARR